MNYIHLYPFLTALKCKSLTGKLNEHLKTNENFKVLVRKRKYTSFKIRVKIYILVKIVFEFLALNGTSKFLRQ